MPAVLFPSTKATHIHEGARIGRLVLIQETRKGRHLAFACICDCGNAKVIRAGHLADETKSCGCYTRDRITKANHRHGEAVRNKITPEYNTWCGMLKRCKNPNHVSYRNYGARGISVCERWKNFENFLSDMGHRPSIDHSIDRINNDGNYEPSNCKWSTRSEQALNRRKRQSKTKH